MSTTKVFENIKFEGLHFGRYQEMLPQLRRDELIKNGVFVEDAEMKRLLSAYTGSAGAEIPLIGRIGDTDALNYDGETDVTFEGIGSLSFRVHSWGRMKGWHAKQFTKDITNGVDPLKYIGMQTAKYWDGQKYNILKSIITGIYASATGDSPNAANAEFVTKHTYNISADADDVMTADTLNNAIQQASGQQKDIYTMVFMHSKVATNLENQKLLQYMKGVDDKGIERDLRMATWNGRTVIIDDSLPYDSSTGQYTTYVVGKGAFYYFPLDVSHPAEYVRDAVTDGGVDKFINRVRGLIHPHGWSFIGTPATNSPTNTEFATGANWQVIQNTTSGEKYPHELIPFLRIISKG